MANYNLKALIQGLKPYFLRKDGNNTVSGDIYPSVGGTYDLGSSTKPFANIYTNSIIATVGTPDEKVKINASDPTEGFLEDKIAAGSYITLGNSGTLLTVNVNPGSFLLRDGTNSLQGNLAVDAGITIDGVDISAFKVEYDAHDVPDHHHPRFSGGAGLTTNVSAQTADVFLRSDGGLEFYLGSVATKPGAGIGRDTSGTFVDVYDTTLDFTTDKLHVNRAHNFVWSGTHEFNSTTQFDGAATFNSAATFNFTTTFNTNPQVYGNINFKSASRTITTDAGFDLTLQPGDDLWLSPADNLHLNPVDFIYLTDGKEFRTDTFSDLVTGIAGLRLWDRDPNYRQLTMGAIKVDELFARVFVADEVRIDRGEEYWSKSYGVVEEDFVVPADEATVDVWFEDSPGLATANLFSVNDWLLFRTIDWDTGLTIQKIWFLVTLKVADGAAADGTTRQQWRIQRKSGGTTGQTVRKGNVALDVGQSGQGWVHLSALEQDGGPFIQIGDWSGSDPSLVSAFTNRVRMGNLDGVAGISGDTWGFAAGNNLGYTPDNASNPFEGIVAGETGFQLYNADLKIYDSGNLLLDLLPDQGLGFQASSTESVSIPLALSWWHDIDTKADALAEIWAWRTSGGSAGLALQTFKYAPTDTLQLVLMANSLNASLILGVNSSGDNSAGLNADTISLDGNTTISGTLQSGDITVTDGTHNAYLQAGITASEARVVLDNNTASGARIDLRSDNDGYFRIFSFDDSYSLATFDSATGDAVIRGGLRVGDTAHSSDGQRDVNFFGDGSVAQPNAFHSKVKIFGGGSQTRHLELYQVDSGDAYVLANYSTLHLNGGANGQAIAFDIGGTEYARLNTTGLGIGESSPADMLHVHKSQAAATRMRISNDNAAGYTTLLFEESGNFRGWVQYSNADNILYYRNNETGRHVFQGGNGVTSASVELQPDQGDDLTDTWRMVADAGGSLWFQKWNGSSWSYVFLLNAAYEVATAIDTAFYATGTGSASSSPDTTASAANAYLDSFDGHIYRSTSSIRYKRDVRDLPDPLGDKAIMALRPVTYRSKAKADDPNDLFVGLIAEEVHDAFGTHRNPYVDYNADGQPEGVRYAALTAPLIATVQNQQRKIDELYQRIEKLENM